MSNSRAPEQPLARLSVFPAGSDPLGAEAAARWMTILLVLGIAARVVRFGLRFPFWYDEAALSSNFLERGYLDLLRPLEGGQTCPILFLWVQLTAVKLLGFSEWSLRLFPLICGLGSLWVFRRVAVRLFRGTAAVIAVGVFAASYPAIRYSAEGKPYGSDLFVALVLAALTLQWLRRPGERRWLWLLVGLVPVAVLLSFPAVFVAGAASAVVAWGLWKRGGIRGWTAWLALNVLLLAAFVATMAAARANLTPENLEGTERYWRDGFPPRGSTAGLAGWLLAAHTGELVAHPFGGKRGASTLTALACATAFVVLCRRREFWLLALLAGPAALNLAAAAMHRYPYGGHVRLAMYLGPAVCLLAGLGLSDWLSSAGRRWPRTRVLVPAVLGLLALLPVGTMLRDAAFPTRYANDLRFRGFSRWFWVNRAYDAELVCLKTDLRVGVDPLLCVEGDEAMYVCYQRICSPRHARGEPPAWDRVSATRPLRCIRFIAPIVPQDEAAIDRWLAQMQSRYRLVGRETYYFPFFEKESDPPRYVNSMVIYQFVPFTESPRSP
jgi:hypothetical protein